MKHNLVQDPIVDESIIGDESRRVAYTTGQIDGFLYWEDCGWSGVPKHYLQRRSLLLAYMDGFTAAVRTYMEAAT